MSTFERAYQLARSGSYADVAALKARLEADGCRAVDTLLATRSIREHLKAICAATYTAAEMHNAARRA
ncbi:MAG TPA: hypothetical protein VMU59_12400 [Caulobacteraceae bacterium]|nr:hypothetical protein [Caulobacteraceae bacterium]